MPSTLTRKLGGFVSLTQEELNCLLDLQSVVRTVEAGKELIHEGQAHRKVYIVRSGWGYSYKTLSDGSRQIINFHLPGDWVGLRGPILGISDHSFAALTDAKVCALEIGRLRKFIVEYPRLTTAILWIALRDEATVVEHLVSLGRRSALERTAHFFVEIAYRLGALSSRREAHFECPLTQYALGDALGLTAIYINRILRRLRERRLLTFCSGTVTIHDLPRLKALASYRGHYLGRDREAD